MDQYFKVKQGSVIDKKIREYFKEGNKMFDFLTYEKEKLGIESLDVGLSHSLDLIFKPTENDFIKFKDKLCFLADEYYIFRRNTKIYKEIKKDQEENNIKDPYLKIEEHLNGIKKARGHLMSYADVNCGFFIDEETDTVYLNVSSDQVVTGEGLISIMAEEYIDVKNKLD